jgi:hypothetical protein
MLGRQTLEVLMAGTAFRGERANERLTPDPRPRISITQAIRSGKITLEAALATYGEGASAGTRRKWQAAAAARPVIE